VEIQAQYGRYGVLHVDSDSSVGFDRMRRVAECAISRETKREEPHNIEETACE
jgi:hypothetical protein